MAESETSERQWAARLHEGERVDTCYVVDSRRLRRSRQGAIYGDLMLADASGAITGRLWDRAEELLAGIEPGDVVRIKGDVESFQDNLQLNIKSLSKMETGYALRDLVRVTERDVRQLYQDLLRTVETIQDDSLRMLLSNIFGAKPGDTETGKGFMRAPAAKGLHHAYLGGLLEHVMNLVPVADAVCDNYGELDRDLLLAGVLLHDIGKIRELKADTRIDITVEGGLLGHIAMGYQYVMDEIAKIPGFPDDLRQKLGHLILSHHGELQFGSPVNPAIPEAIALHHIDNADAQIQRFFDVQRQNPGTDWFYDRTKARWLYLAGGEPAGLAEEGGDESGEAPA